MQGRTVPGAAVRENGECLLSEYSKKVTRCSEEGGGGEGELMLGSAHLAGRYLHVRDIRDRADGRALNAHLRIAVCTRCVTFVRFMCWYRSPGVRGLLMQRRVLHHEI